MADGHIRIGDQDRDLAVARLQEFYVEGRLSVEELEERVTAALNAKTGGELDALFHDLPGGSPRAPQAPEPALPVRFHGSSDSPGSPPSPVPYEDALQVKRRITTGTAAILGGLMMLVFVVVMATGNPWLFIFPLAWLAVHGLVVIARRRNELPPGVPPRQLSYAERDQVMHMIASGRKIQAIKHYRDLTGADLRTAKYTVEAWGRHFGRH